MNVLADQPFDALAGIAFLGLLIGGIWAARYTERMWLRRGIDTTFESFQMNHPEVFVSLRGTIAGVFAYCLTIGPVGGVPAAFVWMFGRGDGPFITGSVLGVLWLAFVVTIGKAWLFPAIHRLFAIPPRLRE